MKQSIDIGEPIPKGVSLGTLKFYAASPKGTPFEICGDAGGPWTAFFCQSGNNAFTGATLTEIKRQIDAFDEDAWRR